MPLLTVSLFRWLTVPKFLSVQTEIHQSKTLKKRKSLFFTGSWPIPRAKWRKCRCCNGRIGQKGQICTEHGNWCAIASGKYSSDLYCLKIMFLLICG